MFSQGSPKDVVSPIREAPFNVGIPDASVTKITSYIEFQISPFL